MRGLTKEEKRKEERKLLDLAELELKHVPQCSEKPSLTFRSVGRLCNQLSSYANMLAAQRLFNVQAYLPSEQTRERIRAFFENVTMPVLTDNTTVTCKVEVRV